MCLLVAWLLICSAIEVKKKKKVATKKPTAAVAAPESKASKGKTKGSVSAHKEQLERLKAAQPEFYQYLQNNDKVFPPDAWSNNPLQDLLAFDGSDDVRLLM